MWQKFKKIPSDLRGVNHLAQDGIRAVLDIAESNHKKIHRMVGLSKSNSDRTEGLTGFVYRSIRTLSQGVSFGIDQSLKLFTQSTTDSDPRSIAREKMVAAINGVVGDHLYRTENSLAITMQLLSQGVALNRQQITQSLKHSKGRLLIMVHGLCLNDLQWQRQQHDHGMMLAKELGFTVIYLCYNSGRHISENGRAFSDLLESTLGANDQLKSIAVVGHSMGGLVSRSACEYAKRERHEWLKQLKKLIFLGTPHHGAWLEKGGGWLDFIVGSIPIISGFADIAHVRSAGIQDLRYGHIVDEDWQQTDGPSVSDGQRQPIPLPESATTYVIAACTCKMPNPMIEATVGDGLVSVGSALGRHKDTRFELQIPAHNQSVSYGVNHMDLLSSKAIYGTLKQWLHNL